MTARTSSQLASVCLVILGIWACGEPAPSPVKDYEDLTARSERLAQEVIIVDTHIDVPYRMEEGMEDISQRTEGGHFRATPVW